MSRIFRGLCVVVCAAPALAEAREFSFRTSEGHEFRGVIDLPTTPPAPDRRLVLMLGGGLANDLDWSVPAPMTISGEPHADAPLISRALTEAGFLTARWSTIRAGDPKADKWPDEVTPYTYDQTLEHARAALSAVRALNLVAPDHVILLGHSLGARRALNLCAEDREIRHVILLSAADIARTGRVGQASKQELRGTAGRIHAEMDRTGDGRVEPWEFQSWAPAPEQDAFRHAADSVMPSGPVAFADLDADDDGVIRRWEIEAWLVYGSRFGLDSERVGLDSRGRAWGEDTLDRGPAALLIYGGLDSWASQGVAIRQRVAATGSQLRANVRFLPGLGHNLSEERDGKMGPISSRATEAVVGWLRTQF